MNLKKIIASSDAAVAVKSMRVEKPRSVWINTDVYGKTDADIAAMRKVAYRDWAYTVTNSQYGKTIFADRYGGTGIVTYGGSGRAAIIDDVQVKGVGATPLVSKSADWHHSHGMMWLEEALREAVFSEVVHREFPCRGIRTLAVIDLGAEALDHNGVSQRTALLVRAFSARPAHVQRAMGFSSVGTSGVAELDHLSDVRRVKLHVEIATELALGKCPLTSLASSLGRQIAYSHVIGWFHGGFTSASTDLNGRLIDFGSARFLPSWRRASFEQSGPCFGEELYYAEVTLATAQLSFKKYGTISTPNVADLGRLLYSSYKDQISITCSELLGLDNISPYSSEKVFEAFSYAFNKAQSERTEAGAISVELEFAREIARILTPKVDSEQANRAWLLSKQRKLGTREQVMEHINRRIGSAYGDDVQIIVESLVELVSRRRPSIFKELDER